MKIERGGNNEAIRVTMTRSDDWHLHIRDGEGMHAVLPYTVRQFERAIIMPNLKPPVTTVKDAEAYRKRIFTALTYRHRFTPLLTLYLTDETSPEEILRANANGFIPAVKYYPANATTNSQAGVTDIRKCYPTLSKMEETGMILSVHGEVTDPAVDIFDREKVFIDRVLSDLVRDFPGLKIILEHVTTQEGVDFVKETGTNIAATITAHHLLMSRNNLFQGGLRPHNYCLPVAKREKHREALVQAAISGNPKFFLGTDSAPHAKNTKENTCGCAGCFTAHAALELYAEAFEQANALEMFEGFASFYGADFYGLPRNQGTITLVKEEWTPREELFFGEGQVVIPFRAGETLQWKLVSD